MGFKEFLYKLFGKVLIGFAFVFFGGGILIFTYTKLTGSSRSIAVGIELAFFMMLIFFALMHFTSILRKEKLNRQKTTFESIEKAEEIYKTANDTLPEDTQKEKRGIVKSVICLIILFILMFVCVFMYNVVPILKIIAVIIAILFMWVNFYSYSQYIHYKNKKMDHVKKITISKFESLNAYNNLMETTIPLNASVSASWNNYLTKFGTQAEYRKKYSDFIYDTCGENSKIINIISDHFDFKLDNEHNYVVQNVDSRRVDGNSTIAFQGLFVYFPNFKLENNYLNIRFTNVKKMLPKTHKGFEKIELDNKYSRFSLFCENGKSPTDLFSETLLEKLVDLDEKYKCKYEIIIKDGEIFIRIFANNLFKSEKIKEIARDIATIDFSRELVQLVYNSLDKNNIVLINQ